MIKTFDTWGGGGVYWMVIMQPQNNKLKVSQKYKIIIVFTALF